MQFTSNPSQRGKTTDIPQLQHLILGIRKKMAPICVRIQLDNIMEINILDQYNSTHQEAVRVQFINVEISHLETRK